MEQNRFFIIFGSSVLLIIILFIMLVRLVRGKKPSNEEETNVLFPSLDPEQRTARALTADQAELSDDAREKVKIKENVEKKAIGEYIDDNPDLVVSILRGWMAEDQG